MAVLVFVGAGPFMLAAVFAVVNSFTPRPLPEAAVFIPMMWWVSVIGYPEAWRFTLVPTLAAAALLWGVLSITRAKSPFLATTRLRLTGTSAVLGALASLVAWEFVSILFDHAMLSEWGRGVILLVVVPTGALTGGLFGLISWHPNPALNTDAVHSQRAG